MLGMPPALETTACANGSTPLVPGVCMWVPLRSGSNFIQSFCEFGAKKGIILLVKLLVLLGLIK